MTSNNPIFVSITNVNTNTAYQQWLAEVKLRFRQSQIKAAVKVNSALLEFYWSLGHDIVCRQAEQTWGSGIVEQLSLDLKEAFPAAKGFSTTNIWYTKKWYLSYSQHLTILHQVGGELGNQKLQQPVGVASYQLQEVFDRTIADNNH